MFEFNSDTCIQVFKMNQPTNDLVVYAFARLKEGESFEPNGSGKMFTKWAGSIVAPDAEACEWVKTTLGNDFFNKHFVRILYASPDRFCGK